MQKLGLLVKETSENRIKNQLRESESVFLVNYAKISGPDFNSLRQTLRNKNASLFVVKNSVARRVFQSSKLESLLKAIEGPCGLVFVKEEPVEASRVLCDFARDHEPFRIKGGFLKDRILQKYDVEALAKLPSRQVLKAQVVMVLNSPILRLAIVLNNILRQLVCCLEQIKNKKGK